MHRAKPSSEPNHKVSHPNLFQPCTINHGCAQHLARQRTRKKSNPNGCQGLETTVIRRQAQLLARQPTRCKYFKLKWLHFCSIRREAQIIKSEKNFENNLNVAKMFTLNSQNITIIIII